jgi:predicted ATPase/class 3 adenylate cyclase
LLDLPSGTVTFLFTDIEGSTALWERNRQAMGGAVERHLALLDAAIRAQGGIPFKTVGDAMQAAFPTAPAAVAAALAAQRALLAEDWGELGVLRVRMAVHVGEASPDTTGDYTAAALNRLSRVLATAHGGQILLTQAVQQLASGALPAGAALRDLGEHRLRDLLEAERVFQLMHPDLPADFSPLRSLEALSHNLPPQPTSFLGRTREVAEVVQLLMRPEARLLTLTGPGGTGKTRLALQAAAELLDDVADGVYFVPVADLADPALVPSAIARVLGVREEGERSAAQRLQDFLRAKELLLVLDNVEHLVEAAPVIGELLGAAPGLKVLATSRVPLRLRAEQEYLVPPLALPRRDPPLSVEQLSQYEAVRLFIERAQAVKPDFIVDNANAPAVVEICHRLDGLPLAIELAAARVRMLPPAALLARLEKRLPLLTGGARDAPARQRTLRATITWSYDHLEPKDQILFQRLSVFAGGCTLEAAEAIGNHDGSLDTFGGVERLAEHSLLRQEADAGSEPRLRMLETVREYGLERLAESGEENATRDAHVACYLALAEQAATTFYTAEEGAWFDRLEVEQANLRGALAWAVARSQLDVLVRLVSALWWFWRVRGHLSEGRMWLEQAIAKTGDAPLPLRTRSLVLAGSLAYFAGDAQRCVRLLEQGLELARATGDQASVTQALVYLANGLAELDELDRAAALGGEALQLARTVGQPVWIVEALASVGHLAWRQGDYDRAAALGEEALALSRAVGFEWGIASALRNLAGADLMRGDHRGAAARYAESLAIAHRQGDKVTMVDCFARLASLAAALGDAQRAARLIGATEALREELSVPIVKPTRADYEQAMNKTRELLGEAAFAAASAHGEGLTLEQAAAEAKAVLADAGQADNLGRNYA